MAEGTVAGRGADNDLGAKYQAQEEPQLPDANPALGTDGLKHVVGALKGKAEQGDRHASDRLYAQTMRCLDYRHAKLAARGQLIESWGAIHGKTDATPAELQARDQVLARIQHTLGTNEPLCGAVHQSYLEAILYDVVLFAARNGNENAAACFVSSPFSSAKRFVDNPDAMNEYRAYARKFAQSGLRKGDWAMVRLLAGASGALGEQTVSLHYNFVPHDQLQYYGYLVLERMGANKESAHDVNAMILGVLQSNNFSPDQLERMQRWAQSTFFRYFVNKPPFDESALLCNQHSYLGSLAQ